MATHACVKTTAHNIGLGEVWVVAGAIQRSREKLCDTGSKAMRMRYQARRQLASILFIELTPEGELDVSILGIGCCEGCNNLAES